jgi:putative transposase
MIAPTFRVSNLRRYPALGRPYFITNVAHDRRPVLIEHIDLLWAAIEIAKERTPFELLAWVILPDHFHLLLDAGKIDVSRILQTIKMSFASNYRKRQGQKTGRTWQNRYWDHIIRDQEDFIRHFDYIHYNPVKHGFVLSPFDWPHSSIRIWRDEGIYRDDWGCRETVVLVGEFGE